MRKRHRKLLYRLLSAFLALCMVMTLSGTGTMNVYAEQEAEKASNIDTMADLDDGSDSSEEEGSDLTEEEGSDSTEEEESDPTEEEGSDPTEEEGNDPTEEEGSNPTEEEGSDPTEEEGSDPIEEEGSDPIEESESLEEEERESSEDKRRNVFRLMPRLDNMADDAAIDLATLSDGATLESGGVYYLSESKTFGSDDIEDNGLKIAAGDPVYIYIPNGVTLTAIGGGINKARTTGGYAGILLPENATLIVLGTGSLVATGGRAGNGGNGKQGTGGTLNISNSTTGNYNGGAGGAGGAGGGGAGAGIGTNGGTGGDGGRGDSIKNGATITSGKQHYNHTFVSGTKGDDGNKAFDCGTIYVQNTITLTATGGTYGSKGSGGNAGGCSYKEKEWNEKTFHVAGGGGGGGGGGAGYTAKGIGTGGAAGGGGGSGGRGSVDYSTSKYSSSNGGSPVSNATCNGAGGQGGGSQGGNETFRGDSGKGTRDEGYYGDIWSEQGGYGGGSGSAGSGSVEKQVLTSGWDDKTYTITFKGENDETVFQQEYIYGTEDTVTVPNYTPAEGCFLGWEASVYGATTKSGADLTSTSTYTDTKVYQPGQSIKLEAGVSGSIELRPIMGTLSGTNAQTEVLTIPAEEMNQAVTYHTYSVKTTLDGVVTDMGNLTLKDDEETVTISYENGSYTYITSKNATYTILQNGRSLGATVTAGETAVIPYKTMTITTTLNGSTSSVPGDVAISGTDAPSLTTESDSGIYTAVDLASNTNEYHILVDGADTGETISLGGSKTLAYYSTTVNIGGNTAAESVALRENDGEHTYLLTEKASNQFVLVKPAIEGSYTLYVNGFKTDITTINLSQGNSIDVNVFTTVVKTTLNGRLTDIDNVYVGEQQAICESEGKYTAMSVMTGDAPTEIITIADRNVGSVTIGTEKTVSYYSVEYCHGSTEANILPTDNMIYLENDVVTILSSVTPKDNAYTFGGWNVLGNVKQPGDTFRMPSAKVEIPVNWKETVYNISYELQEPSAINDSDNPESYTISSTFTLEEPTLEGYIFEGWTYGEVTAPTEVVTIPQGTRGELTFAANWILKTYEISADKSEVDFGSRISNYEVDDTLEESIGITSTGNQDITLKTPVCDNNNFVISVTNMKTSLAGNGGYTEFSVQPKAGLANGTYRGTITISTNEENCNTVTIPVSFEVGKDGTPPEATITVGENKWEDIVFEPEDIYYYNSQQTVTIAATDTETGVKEINYYIATQPLKWSDDEDKEDWIASEGEESVLINWQLYDEANKPVISDDGSYYVYVRVTDNASNVTDISTDMILIDKTAPIAEFVEDTEVLTNNGTFTGKKQVKVTDDRLTEVSLNGENCELSEDGTCTFTMNPNENVSQQIVAKDEAGNVATINLTINPREYVITYDSNGAIGTIEPEIAKEQIAHTVANSSEITPQAGMRFAHWAVDSVDATTTIESGGSYVFEDNATLYAIWECIPYNITYHLNGGTNALTNPTTYTVATADIALAEPSKDGYIFAGWTWEAAEGVGDGEQSSPVKEVLIPTGSIGDKEFTANWIAKDYTITSEMEAEGVLFDAKLEYVYTTESKDITIRNAGNWSVNLKTPTSDESNSAFVIGEYSKTVIEPGETAAFTISTKEKLDVGTYAETIIVETEEGTSVSVSVSFTVEGDYNAPTGSITIKDNKWTEFFNSITFGVFFNKTQDVTIESEDLVNGADVNTGVGKVYYYISETEMNKVDLESLQFDAWKEYNKKFSINPDDIVVVYAKIIDNAENVTYISSNGLVFDATAPVILGIEDGKIYCENQRITIKENNLESVKVNGKEVILTDNTYELVGAEEKYTVVVSDKAGNTVSKTATVVGSHDMSEANCTETSKCQRKDCDHTEGSALGHDWSGEWTVTKAATTKYEGKKETLCVRGCGQKKVAMIPVLGETDNNGNLEKHVEIEPEATIEEAILGNSKDEILEAGNIFEAAEKEEIVKGADARVWIEISDADETDITSSEKEKVEDEATKVLGDDLNITYIEVDLFKQLGDEEVKQIKNPGVAIKITITIPEELINTNASVTREYKMFRLHEGQVDIIDGTFNAKTREFSFETDKFSPYAIVYKDSKVKNEGGGYDIPSNGEDNDSDGVESNTSTKEESKIPAQGGSGTSTNEGKGTLANGGRDTLIGGKDTSIDKGNNTSSNGGGNILANAGNESGREDGNGSTEEQKKTQKAEVIDSISKEEKEQFKDALEELQKKAPSLQPGPYIKVVVGEVTEEGGNIVNGEGTIGSENTMTSEGAIGSESAMNGEGAMGDKNTTTSVGIEAGEDGKVRFTIDIPKEIAKEGRTYYLVTVDKDGNIVVLQNESIVNGTLTFTGDPNATYQIIYEDGGATLPDVLNENGWLVDENGKSVTVNTNHCFLHYIVLLLAAIGILLTLIFRGKQKRQLLIIAIDTIAMIILILIGWCIWDIVVTILGVAIMCAIFLWSKKNKEESNELSYE